MSMSCLGDKSTACLYRSENRRRLHFFHLPTTPLANCAARNPTACTTAGFLSTSLFCLRCFVRLRLWFLRHALLRRARLRILPFTTCANGYATYCTLTSATHGGYFHAVIGTLALDLRLSALRCSVLHARRGLRSEEHTSELQSRGHLVCRLLLEKKK